MSRKSRRRIRRKVKPPGKQTPEEIAAERIAAVRDTARADLELQNLGLTAWPSALSELKNLATLRLDGNAIRELPSALGNFEHLYGLSLAENKLRTLPSILGELKSLRVLYLHGNPDLGLPPEVLGPSMEDVIRRAAAPASAQAILDFYFSRQSAGGRPLDEVKLVIVGRGGAGKSSLVEKLIHGTFTKGKPETAGVALCDWTMEECPDGGPVTAHVWDFAGQVITHSTHQFFFSTRALYVLVLTGRENSEREDAEYWLRLIAAFGTDADGNGPPVVVALNKWDESGSRPRIDRRALRERFPFIVEIVETDCQTATGIAKLRVALCRVAGGMPWVRDIFPEEFRKVKQRLQTMDEMHLGYDRYRTLCRENGVTEEGKQDSLSEILHRLGVALNYRDDPRLRMRPC